MSKKTTAKKRTTQKTNNKDKEYAAQYLSKNLKMPKEEIAKELNISVSQVESMLNSFKETDSPPKEVQKTNSRSQNLMIRHTSSKKNNNVSIMTEAASQYNDEVKKNLQKKSNNFRDCTYSPRNG